MKILGIVASCRTMGNSEILVKEALMAAEEQGAEVEIVRWNDYKIFHCEGDAACVFGGKGCKYRDKDDHDMLLNQIYGFDGLVLGVPCYFLEAHAVIKQFIDRLFILLTQPSRVRGKPAAIIVPYATRGWTSYAFLQPTIMMHQLGMDIIDKVLVHVQAVSEAAASPGALEQARKVGIELVESIKTGDHSYRGDPGICPICYERDIHILKDNATVECGICGIRGTLTVVDGKIKVYFPEEQFKWHRFSFENMYRHVTYEIKPSKDYFTKAWPEFKQKRVKYAEYLDIKRSLPESDKTR
jgi:multimeric flavodoxin WrbA